MPGQGAYIRIQNKSSIEVEIKLVKGRKIDDQGLDSIAGNVGPGEQLPREGQGKKRYDGIYQYIEGDVRNRFQKDGYFAMEAHPMDGSPCSKLDLILNIV